MQVDIKLVRQLAELLNETGLTEIEVEDDDRKIRVARTVQAASVAVAAPAPVAAPAAAPAAAPVAPTALSLIHI
jgi:acetyl-CoA carboxylase biotin carboxyl carrier protein